MARPVAPDAGVDERGVGEVVDAERVLEPGVARRGVDQPDGRELFDVPEALERAGVE